MNFISLSSIHTTMHTFITDELKEKFADTKGAIQIWGGITLHMTNVTFIDSYLESSQINRHNFSHRGCHYKASEFTRIAFHQNNIAKILLAGH